MQNVCYCDISVKHQFTKDAIYGFDFPDATTFN